MDPALRYLQVHDLRYTWDPCNYQSSQSRAFLMDCTPLSPFNLQLTSGYVPCMVSIKPHSTPY